MRNRKIAPRRALKMGKKRNTRRGRKAGLSPSRQYATIVETIATLDVMADNGYQTTFNLSQFFRATTLAKNFQYYRATKVKWEYLPLYNTFQENNSVAAVAKPQFYFIMNRDQDVNFSGLAGPAALFSIQSAGADPSAFIKNKEIIYKPNWCSPGLTAITTQYGNAPLPVPGPAINAVTGVYSLGLKKQYGWIPTPNKDAWANPSIANNPLNPVAGVIANSDMAPVLNAAVQYNGHNIYIQQDNDPNVPVCKVVCTVTWEFKGGKNLYAVGPTGVSTMANKEAN